MVQCHQKPSIEDHSDHSISIPSLQVNGQNTHNLVKAYRIAMGDISGNIQYHQSGILQQKEPCIYAGLVYGKPWTRDAAINVWNGMGLLAPKVAKNTLFAQVEEDKDGQYQIIGQYWDKIIWTIGAWNYYLYTGDQEFLKMAFECTQNTLSILEKDEFSQDIGLFRGPAVYGDGVAAYPLIYTRHQIKEKSGSYSGIEEWPNVNEDIKHPVGYGIPMHALSTNAVYFQAYTLLTKMANELKIEAQEEWKTKANDLKQSINRHFWNEEKGNYHYLIDPFGNCDSQESMGIAFSLLFDIAPPENIEKIFRSTHIEPAGIPCVYPSFERFRIDSLDGYGRHSGTVWPHVQGFWADAAMKYGKEEVFLHEFEALSRHALRDFQFVEIYHPIQETPYGGLQEPHLEEGLEWFCAERQTWSATAYLRMIFKNIIGMEFSEKGIHFKPYLPDSINEISLLGLNYRDLVIDLHITRSEIQKKSISINGEIVDQAFISSHSKGKILLEMTI